MAFCQAAPSFEGDLPGAEVAYLNEVFMKICMVLLNLDSVSYDTRVRKEASSLTKLGHRVRLVALRHPGESPCSTMDGFELSLFPLRTRNLPSSIILWPFKYAEFILKSILVMLRFRADVYHAHDLNTLPIAWFLARFTRARVIYDSHELFTERPIEATHFWKRVERFLITRVDAVIAANEERAAVMLHEYGAAEVPEIIMNCPASIAIGKTNVTVRDRLPEGMRDRRIVLYQGGLSPNRCLESLVLSARFLENAVVVFVGKESIFSESVLKSLVREHGLEERVFFFSPVDSSILVQYISSADLGVVIYKNSCRNNYLCAPNKLFDYCMAGVPVIGCDFPVIRRIVQTYGVGHLFDPESPGAIAEAANALLKDNFALQNARAATACISEEFTWEREVQKLARIYDRFQPKSQTDKNRAKLQY